MESKSVIFAIEGGDALCLVKQHIADRIAAQEAARELAKELGVEHIYTDRFEGKLLGVAFRRGFVHKDFTKPDRKNISYPRKGSEWEKRFLAQTGYTNPVHLISEFFSIPLSLSYTCEGGGTGFTGVGNPFVECGFLYMSAEGPYAMWVPDVPACVARREADGSRVAEPAKSFKLEIDGCRRIDQEEWDLIAAQYKFDQKKREREKQEDAAEVTV